MGINKKELSKLSPKERIKKLKLLEEERKKEVNEIERLIRESMQELKTDKLAEEVAPEQRVVDISRLFEASGEQRLERTAREEAPPVALMKGTRGYATVPQLEYDSYRLNKLVSMGGISTEEDKKFVDEAGARVLMAERYMSEAEKIAGKLDSARSALYKLRKETGLG